MANIVTICRIALSLALLVPPVLSPPFLMLYAVAGITDMLDGYLARRTGTESQLGAMLDSIADCILAIVCLAKILPTIATPTWLYLWVVVIVLIKASNVICGRILEKRLVMLHTKANKIAGLLVFLTPFALPFFDVAIPAVPACAMATLAAIQEGHLIRAGITDA